MFKNSLSTLLLSAIYVFSIINAQRTQQLSDIIQEMKDKQATRDKYSKIAIQVQSSKPIWKSQVLDSFNYNDENILSLATLKLDPLEYQALQPSPDFDSFLQSTTNSSTFVYPENFNVTAKWPKCADSINTVVDQSYCGSCWAVATATAASDRICISSNGAKNTRLSYQDLLECSINGSKGCSGGSLIYAYYYWQTTGIVTGGDYLSKGNCKPYSFAPCTSNRALAGTPVCTRRNTTLTCTKSCQKGYLNPYATEVSTNKAKTVYSVPTEAAMIKEIFNNGSLTCAFMVHQDLMTYKSGIYVYTTGKLLGGHAIKVIGWGVENGVKYWLIANSWGTKWGINGFFKILRGVNHLQIESFCVAGLPL